MESSSFILSHDGKKISRWDEVKKINKYSMKKIHPTIEKCIYDITHNNFDLLFMSVLNDKTPIFDSKTVINLETFAIGLKSNKALSGVFIRKKIFMSAIKNK